MEVRTVLLSLFLVITYNFLLYYAYVVNNLPIFPNTLEGFSLIVSFDTALYISYIFGLRFPTFTLMSYAFFTYTLTLSLLTKNLNFLYQTVPSFLITLLILSLFQSPVELRLRRLREERERLIKKIEENERERKLLKEEVKLLKERIRLEEESEESLKKLRERVKELEEKEKRLLETNRRLFNLLEEGLQRERVSPREELRFLRRERKKLVKELLTYQELLRELERENENLKEEKFKMSKEIYQLKEEIKKLKAKEEGINWKKVFNLIFTNLEFEERAIGEFEKLDEGRKRSFLKELIKLQELKRIKISSLKTKRDVFKLKPKGGRIYFTYGKQRLWKVLGFLDSEDDKEKERYLRDVLP